MEWTEKYNCHSLNINGLFKINIDWGMSGEHGYIIKYGNRQVKDAIPDLATAKRIAIRNVSKHMVKALADLSLLIDEKGDN